MQLLCFVFKDTNSPFKNTKLYQTSCQRRVGEEVMEGGEPPLPPPTENNVSVILNSANIVRTGFRSLT